MKGSVILSTLIVCIPFMCNAAAANQRYGQPWLSVLSFTCRQSTSSCVGVVVDRNWVLTTASCFWKCDVEIPVQLSVYINIPPKAQKRIASSIVNGDKVSGTLVWQHPEYSSRTLANNLALVKLDCHNHALEKLSLASNCSADEAHDSYSNGYMYAKKRSIKFKEIDDGRDEKPKCFVKRGTWYYHVTILQMISAKFDRHSCTVTLICNHTSQLKSFMQENKPNCKSPSTSTVIPSPETTTTTEVLLSTLIPISEIQTSMQAPTSTVIQSAETTEVPISTSIPISEIQTSIQASTSTVVPTLTTTEVLVSTSIPISEIQTSMRAPTSTMIQSVETTVTVVSISTSTPISEIQTSILAPTSTVIPTHETTVAPVSTSIEVQTTIQAPTSTVIPSPETITTTEVPISNSISEIPISMRVSTSSAIPTRIPIETSTLKHVQVPVSTSVQNTEIPASTVIPTPIPIETSISEKHLEVPVSTPDSLKMSTSMEVPSPSTISTPVSTKTSNSTQTSTMHMQATTESSLMPTPTSAVIPSSAIAEVVTLDHSSQVPIETPAKTPTSGCLLTIPNGKVAMLQPSAEHPGFLILLYTCNLGYKFESGTEEQTYGCNDGKMASKPPPCQRITCPPIEPIANGEVVVSGSGLGSTATYSCNKGFVLFDGYTVRVCGPNHQWSGNAGVCRRVCPFPQSLICNDGQRISPTVLKYGRIGDSVNYIVKDGYIVIGEAPVCQPNSTWSTSPKCIKLCNEKQVIANATVEIHRNASSYTRKIVCDEGYRAVGSNEQYCKNGVWMSTPRFMECERFKACDQLNLENGKFTDMMHSTRQIVRMECNEGYHLEPPRSAVIMCSNGQWIPSIPRCVED